MTLCPPLCIIQARYHSTRFPGKMLAKLQGETLIERAVHIAKIAFGDEHVIVAIPATDREGPLGQELLRIRARSFAFDSDDESDVLNRVHACASTYRWHPDAVIVRYTPDDPDKDVIMLRRVAAGERLPVEWGGEAFTLAQLVTANHLVRDAFSREHITHAFFTYDAPRDPTSWTIDTPAHLAARQAV